ncbi:MAG TPA: type IV secretory system conjugative DNA transfer family protein, partial [Verrucomicrobiae bacterium]|nr:type IV secretory system conjugative DNA transfer family protein [Verrucomicrobiae bacterium]
MLADDFQHQAALGARLRVGDWQLYWPFAWFEWQVRAGDAFRHVFARAWLLFMLGSGATLGLLIVSTRSAGLSLKPVGQGAWGDLADAVRAGLCASTGVVLGRLEGELLCFNGPEHHLLIGASRSGKGRGQIVPTLLAWPHSALVLDIKGELADGDARVGFPGTARFRAQLGPVLRFAPTKARSCAFNPLFEVRRGPNEVRDVMNLVEVIVDPAGDGRHNDFWDRMARAIICGVTLHVLYTE